MKTKHVELLQRLEQFQLDSTEAALPFSARLARENNWSPAYTQRVIAEYKRFAFLAVAAGHPVSPAEDVDQAWHLHLIYSQDYWKVFCPEILGQPLHHQPSRGGDGEREKFGDWYRQTLESYRALLGEAPPGDIWPAPELRELEKHDFLRVDRQKHWVIPKPAIRFEKWVVRAARPLRSATRRPEWWSAPLRKGLLPPFGSLFSFRPASRPRYPGANFQTRSQKFAVALGFLALTILCSGAVLAQGLNPFDWRGSEFLKFFAFLFPGCFGLALWLRWKLRTPIASEPLDLPELDGYATAFLNGGRILAVNTAIANLTRQKAMRVDATSGKITSLIPQPDFAHELEQAVYVAARSTDGTKVANVRLATKPVVTVIGEDLQARGLVVADDRARLVRWLPLMLALIAVTAGVIKIGIGLLRDKPVGYLLVLCIVSLLLSLVVLGRHPLRSRQGDAVFQQLKARHLGGRELGRNLSGVSSAEFATVVGLFGMTALADTPLQDLRKSLQPPGGGSSGGSSCGSSCGGGGGCGGGGCGGCGG